MAVLDSSLSYYALTFTADAAGTIVLETLSHWAGWADKDQRVELREPSMVRAEAFIEVWESQSEPYLVVKNDAEWFIFLLLGGHALVEKKTAEKYLRTTLASSPSIRTGGVRFGFTAPGLLPAGAERHAPTPRLRGKVLRRDLRRCRVCGRSPANNVDVELHVHHIRLSGRGGLTVAENLITLCHTCHHGLDPHEDHTLFDLVPENDEQYALGVARYREQLYKEFDQPIPRRKRR